MTHKERSEIGISLQFLSQSLVNIARDLERLTQKLLKEDAKQKKRKGRASSKAKESDKEASRASVPVR